MGAARRYANHSEGQGGGLARLNAALEGLRYEPPAGGGFAGAATLAVLADDLGNTGTGGAGTALANVMVDVERTNAPPVVAIGVDAWAGHEDVALTVGLALSARDADGAALLDARERDGAAGARHARAHVDGRGVARGRG